MAEQAQIIRWENPPPQHGNSRSALEPVAAALRARPGVWAVIDERRTPGAASGLAYRIRSGAGPFGPRGSFEAKAVGPAGGQSSAVYARYVAAEEAS